MKIGHYLFEARNRAGLTQEQLSEKLGLSAQAVSSWERDEYMPDTEHLIALAGALKVSLDTLVHGAEFPVGEWRSFYNDPEHMYTFLKARAQAYGWNQVLAALPFMKEKHANHEPRKGLGNEPYISHPLTLACYLLAAGIRDGDAVAAALLHDVVEDAEPPVTPEELPVNDRIREAVRLVSHNTYPGNKEKNKPVYFGNIAKNPLAALIKCVDRYHNLSTMADGYTRDELIRYIRQSETYVFPLLDVIKQAPEYNDIAWFLRNNMTALVESYKRLL